MGKTEDEIRRQNHEKLRNIIGKIIAQTLIIEKYVNDLIILHYVREERRDDFLNQVLYDEGFTSAMKRKILARTGILAKEHKGLSKDIELVFEIRNLVAHCHQTMALDKVEIYHRKEGSIDVEKLEAEFKELNTKVLITLLGITIDLHNQVELTEGSKITKK